VPRDSLVRRLTGRRVCRASGHPYHVDFQPPQREGVCDVDGSELYQRVDDAIETVLNRLVVYERETAPLIAFYRDRDRLTLIDGDAPPLDVAARLRSAVGL
jgi:adenylate kinase